MPLMVWDKTLDVGVPEMNKEHGELLDTMNRLFDAHHAGQSGAPIIALIDQLAKVCIKHFADEERYMEKIGFPGVGRHKIIHATLLERFTKYVAQIKGAGGKASPDFFAFLKMWLSAHITGVDSKYGEYARTGAKRLAS